MKKIVTLLLAILLLVGCSGTATSSSSTEPVQTVEEKYEWEGDLDELGRRYIALMKAFEPQEKNVNNTTDDPSFDEFLNKVFAETMEEDYMSMHFTVVNYQNYGIEKPTPGWGDLKWDDREALKETCEMMEELISFDYDSLSYTQQYDYETLKYSLLETLAGLCYSRYETLFGQGNSLYSNLISNLTNFTFYDEESVQDYLLVLADTDRYLEDALTYTAEQAKIGVILTDTSIDELDDYVNSFLSGDNVILDAFETGILSLDLDETVRNDYIAQAKTIIEEEILPAYQNLVNEVEQYRGQTTAQDQAVCNLNKDYAELVYMLAGSNNKNIDEMFNSCEEYVLEMINDFNDALSESNVNAFYDLYELPELMNDSYYEQLESLRMLLEKAYPALPDVSYTVSEDSAAASSTVAYYYEAPIDNLDQNIIRVNSNVSKDDLLYNYLTLAHEGFPGHLYQHIYYQNTNPNVFHSTQNFSGYTEGYAVDAQCTIADLLANNEEVASIIKCYEFAYFTQYSLLDMGINYYGWSVDELEEYMQKIGYDSDQAENYAEFFYEYLVDMPGVYCSYGLGSVFFHELETEAREAMGSKFDLVSYHDTILKHGPLPFNILEGAVEEYTGE